MTGKLRIGMVGYAFMGAAHAHAWRTAARFFDLPLTPSLIALGGRNRDAVIAAADRLGFAGAETDWRALVARPDVDLVDICTPGDLHAEIAIAALAAGKHVLCEKPLANSVAEAEAMVKAAEKAKTEGVYAMCGYSYRRTPALALARQLIAEGRLGTIRHVRAHYLQDWLADPESPMTWRLDRTKAGSGALGDLGAHLIDTAQWLTGRPITGVSAVTETFVRTRPRTGGSGLSKSTAAEGEGPTGEVTVDDAAIFHARFAGGAIGSFEATRFATGRKNAFRIEINGSGGALAFDFEDNNVLHYFSVDDDTAVQGFRRILVTEAEHPYAGAWWPPGHGLGYEHNFTHQVSDLVAAIAARRQPRPGFAEALTVQRVLAAVEDSAGHGAIWTEVPS